MTHNRLWVVRSEGARSGGLKTMGAVLALWVGTLAAFAPTTSFSAPAMFSVSPDNGQAMVFAALRSTKSNILINIYEFSNPGIANEVALLIKRGVSVQILIEAEPVGGIRITQKNIMEGLLGLMRESIRRAQAGGLRVPRHGFFVMTKSNGGTRRFVYDHAKYMVIDQTDVWVSSENFGKGAYSAPNVRGNRGWHTLVHEPLLAKKFTEMFLDDSSLSYGDIRDCLAHGLPTMPEKPDSARPDVPRQVPSAVVGKGEVRSWQMVTSPNSLKAVGSMLGAATRSLSFQYMDLPMIWKDPVNGSQHENPIVGAIIHAAKKGAITRVLLNDQDAFSVAPVFNPGKALQLTQSSDPIQKPRADRNRETVCYLRSVARTYGIPLKAKIVDVNATGITYIHNKGAVVDGFRTLVSSINGTRNSVMNNRETALILNGQDPAYYYGKVFDNDWDLSGAGAPIDCSRLRFSHSN